MLAKVLLDLIPIAEYRILGPGAQVALGLDMKVGFADLHFKSDSLGQPDSVSVVLSLVDVIDRRHDANRAVWWRSSFVECYGSVTCDYSSGPASVSRGISLGRAFNPTFHPSTL
jgi:hypothetical protein